MASWMQQHPIVLSISAPFGSPHFVVVVPPRQFGNLLVTERTKSMLAFPEGKHLSFSPEGAFHFHAQALLAHTLPMRGQRDSLLPGF